MNGKIGQIFTWGVSTYRLVMKNKLVAVLCFLVPGLFHTFNPVGSLNWDVMILSLTLMLYAVVSIIFVLTNENTKVGKGQEIAEDLVKGYFEGQRDHAAIGQELLSKSKTLSEHTKASNERLDKRVEKLSEKREQKKSTSPGKNVMMIIYIFLLAIAVAMFIWRSFFVNVVQIIIGCLLIADAISSLITVAAAYKSGLPMKDKIVSVILSIFTIGLGVTFILLPANTSALVYRITGIMLIVKAVSELIVMIHNREVFSSIKDTIDQIKEQ